MSRVLSPPGPSLPQGIPIGTRVAPERRRGGPGAAEGLALVGHGTRCLRGEAELRALCRLVERACPEVAVGVGFLELTDPPAGAVLDEMVAAGCRRVVVLPMVLLAAGHAKNDVPAVVLDARQRHPGVAIEAGRPLGVARQAVAVLGETVLDAGGAGLPLLVVARGTSDPDANADAHKAARLVAEWTGAPFVHVGFSGVTGPSVPDAALVFARLGYRRVVVVWWYLCHGALIERDQAELRAFERRTGVAVLTAGHLGPDARLVPLVVDRYREVLQGPVAAQCDMCAYRAPWPGRESRVGQPVGVGHSHLAAAHRARVSLPGVEGI